MIHVLETALPVFLTLGLGMLCRATRLLTAEGVKALKSVAVNITLPAVLFSAFATAEYSAKSIAIPVFIFALCVLAFFLGRIGCNLLKIPGRLSPFMATGFEAGMLGYALFTLLMLSGSGDWRGAVREALVSPTIWAICAGLLLGATGAFRALAPSGVSGILTSVASFVAAPTSAIILLSIGYDLVPKEIRWAKTAKIVALRVGVMAVILALALLVNRLILGGAMHTDALLMLMILPPPYVLPVFADAGDERANVSSALSVLTLLSLVLFAVLTAIYH